tara:strand:- start:92 stop:349 length:258 start_codon:yes stop_codon:yes gene_type:complete
LTEESEKKDNPYLKIGFWNGLVYTTAFVILFPWSLLYLLIFRGTENTKYFLVFFVRDLLITVISIIIIIVPAIYYLISWIAQFFN